MSKYKLSGFTLIEILLVVLFLAVIASFVMVAIRPEKRMKDSRDMQRKADIAAILNAIKQYSIDNNGILPTVINQDSNCLAPTAWAQVCRTDVAALTCVASGMINLSALTDNTKYLVAIPIDPKATSPYGAGYNVVKDANNRVTVCAPLAETSTPVIFTY